MHASAIKKLKKLNCNFIVPLDRFPATFVAPKLFVTVAISSHCCRAVFVRAIVVRLCVRPCVCVPAHACVCCELPGTFSFCPPSLSSSSKPFSLITLNIHGSCARTIRETRPHKYNQPTGSLLISAYMHSHIFAHLLFTKTFYD